MHSTLDLSRTGILTVIVALIVLGGVRETPAQPDSPTSSRDFKAYWYAGEAEMNRYELHQSRYGEVREGDAVLIFVTEDFLPETQVKYEGLPAPDSPVSVLKLNAMRKFLTGVYPYSTMTSAFTPVDPGNQGTYKVTTSVQEWCGHVFMQLNRRPEGFDGRYFSYFQGEGDREFDLPVAVLEDELWNLIRLNPGTLPTGNFLVIPGTLFLRLMHKEVAPYKATATLKDYTDETLASAPLRQYRLEYENLNRTLTITFEAEFPHGILSWEETTAPLGDREGVETTRAVRTHTIKLDYWNHNGLEGTELRARLGLD